MTGLNPERLITPYDTGVENRLVELIEGANRIRFMIFGANLPAFFDALKAASLKGADIKGIFDMRQSTLPGEKKLLTNFMTELPAAHLYYLFGTSPQKSQIIHMKALWADYVPETTYASISYSDWRNSLSDHYPVVFHGSWNFTTEASQQVNNVTIETDINFAAQLDKSFEQLWTWISANEQRYQKAYTMDTTTLEELGITQVTEY